MGTQYKNLQDQLNRSMPIADDIKLGDLLQELLDANNDLATKYNALLAKLDADVGVTDIDYAVSLSANDSNLKTINQRG